jgi:hypothetical protein
VGVDVGVCLWLDFFKYFLAVLFELRVLCLLGKCLITLAIAPSM